MIFFGDALTLCDSLAEDTSASDFGIHRVCLGYRTPPSLTITSREKPGTSQTNSAALPSSSPPSAPRLPFPPSKAIDTLANPQPQAPTRKLTILTTIKYNTLSPITFLPPPIIPVLCPPLLLPRICPPLPIAALRSLLLFLGSTAPPVNTPISPLPSNLVGSAYRPAKGFSWSRFSLESWLCEAKVARSRRS